MRNTIEKVNHFSAHLNAFLTPARQKYFQDQLKNDLTIHLSELDEFTFDDAVDVFRTIGIVYFYKFHKFLKNQNEQLTIEDLSEVSDAFVNLFKNLTFNFEGRLYQADELIDWEDFFEIIFWESQTIHLSDDKFGSEIATDLAKTAVVNDLAEKDCHDLIAGFRLVVQTRIAAIIGLPDEINEELQGRLNYYCDEGFTQSIKQFNSPQILLGILNNEIMDFAKEGFSNMNLFLQNLINFENAALKMLSSYDSLIEKHAVDLKTFLEALTDSTVDNSVLEIKKALIDHALGQFLHKMSQENEDAAGIYSGSGKDFGSIN